MEEFFNFIRIKNLIETVQQSSGKKLFWVFDTSAAIKPAERIIISR